ncbi:MAG TPA: protein-L-isoaspartate O-methyltransferase [Lysobacter sp.]|nr:protein-L-isoaspartate O-methyltransferase [Lysobacter sp.]
MTPSLDYAKARETMVEQQVRPWDVLDPRVLDVLVRLPREAFFAETHRALAYTDIELPIGHGERSWKPVLDGRALQALLPQPGDAVLEIGTGSGYLSACFGRLAREVTSLERHADLADAARARIDGLGLGQNIAIETADAFAWDTDRRFDAICVGGAVDAIPERFLQWLSPNGRMFVVRGRAPAMEAVRVDARNGVNDQRIQSLFETVVPYLAGAAPAPAFQF